MSSTVPFPTPDFPSPEEVAAWLREGAPDTGDAAPPAPLDSALLEGQIMVALRYTGAVSEAMAGAAGRIASRMIALALDLVAAQLAANGLILDEYDTVLTLYLDKADEDTQAAGAPCRRRS
jgi:hypothetical protein